MQFDLLSAKGVLPWVLAGGLAFSAGADEAFGTSPVGGEVCLGGQN